MAGKPFNPFDDDDNMEFVPGGGQEEAPPAADPVANQATHIKPIPIERPKRKSNLKLDFNEIEEQGTDTRGAMKIGAEKLGADEFLTGIKRKDYDDALQKARALQSSATVAPVQATGVVRKVRWPLFVFALAAVLFVAALGGGIYEYKQYFENQEAARAKAMQDLTHSH